MLLQGPWRGTSEFPNVGCATSFSIHRLIILMLKMKSALVCFFLEVPVLQRQLSDSNKHIDICMSDQQYSNNRRSRWSDARLLASSSRPPTAGCGRLPTGCWVKLKLISQTALSLLRVSVLQHQAVRSPLIPFNDLFFFYFLHGSPVTWLNTTQNIPWIQSLF